MSVGDVIAASGMVVREFSPVALLVGGMSLAALVLSWVIGLLGIGSARGVRGTYGAGLQARAGGAVGRRLTAAEARMMSSAPEIAKRLKKGYRVAKRAEAGVRNDIRQLTE